MAEAAGLVLGGIALAGLVSTCVEIVEYLESAKNRARDFRLALTKVNLIKQRLRAWGAALPVGVPHDPQSNHTIAPTGCGVLIEETLFGIKILLDKTNEMSKRHCYRGPNHRWDLSSPSASRLSAVKLPYRSHSVISDIGLPTDRRASTGTSHPRLPQLLFSFQLKFLWVFQDRKRFDNVIEQLDFLLSNLEKISETLQDRREMPQGNTSEQRAAPSALGPDERSEESDHKSAEGGEMHVSRDLTKDIYQPPALLTLWQPQQYASKEVVVYVPPQPKPLQEGTDLPDPPQTTDQCENGCATSNASGGHEFKGNKSHDTSKHIEGIVGTALESTKKHSFTGNDSHGRSLMVLGETDHKSLEMILAHEIEKKKD